MIVNFLFKLSSGLKLNCIDYQSSDTMAETENEIQIERYFNQEKEYINTGHKNFKINIERKNQAPEVPPELNILNRPPQNGATLNQNGAVPCRPKRGTAFLSRNKNDRNKVVPGTRSFCEGLALTEILIAVQCSSFLFLFKVCH